MVAVAGLASPARESPSPLALLGGALSDLSSVVALMTLILLGAIARFPCDCNIICNLSSFD